MNLNLSVTVRWTVDGYHRWPDAVDVAGTARGYLADRHRHRFGMAVTIPVDHADRDIEFHDLLDWCHQLYEHGHEFDTLSCEQIGTDIARRVMLEFGAPWARVQVDEDDYVVATIEATA
jgi:hypothetical protein